MNYGILETDIVARLNQYFIDNSVSNLFEAVEIPENEGDYRKAFTKSRATVQYLESDFDPSSSVNQVVQEEKVRFRVSFEARKLRGEGGIYQLMDLVKKSLIGYRPPNCERVTVYRYTVINFEQNLWQPALDFQTRAINVQAFEDEPDPIGGNFVGLTGNETFNNE